MASVQAIIASATGYKSGANEISMMGLYENKTLEGLTKWQGFRDDVTQCTYWPGTAQETCSSVTKWNLKNIVNLGVPALFNMGCLQSFGCTAGGCASCASYDSAAGSFISGISIVADIKTAPGAVPSLTITPQSGALNITWGLVADPTGLSEVFAYRVEIWKGTTKDVSSFILKGFTEAGLRNVTIGGLTNGQLYTVDVYALSHNNVYSPLSSKTGTPVGATNPAVFNVCWGTAITPPCKIPPDLPAITAGTSFKIEADIANSGPNGKVRAVIKADGTVISDQNSTLNVYPAGGLWSPQVTYTMPSKNVALVVEAYGWDGTNWVLKDSKSLTISTSAPACSSIDLVPYSANVKAGDKITYTATATPSTQAFTVKFKLRDGTVLGQCTTSGGTCQFVWDTTGRTPGTYYVTAYVEGQCQSTESAVNISAPINQWNVNIYVRDSSTGNPVEGAGVTVGTQAKVTDAAGFVQFRVDEGQIFITISKTGYVTQTDTQYVFSDKTLNYSFVPSGAAKGSIQFVSVPAGAKIWLAPIGQTPVDQNAKTPFTITDIPAGKYAFVLTLTGYNDTTGEVEVIGGSTVQVYATLSPVSTTGSLSFYSSPLGAEIFINDVDQKVTTPSTITGLAPGTYNLKLTLAGYQDWTGTVDIKAGQTTYLIPALTPLTTIGALEINTVPKGARVFLDGKDQFKITPATITNLLAKSYDYKLVLEGYKDATGKVTIEANKTTVLNVTMAKPGVAPSTAIIAAVGIAAGIVILAVAASR